MVIDSGLRENIAQSIADRLWEGYVDDLCYELADSVLVIPEIKEALELVEDYSSLTPMTNEQIRAAMDRIYLSDTPAKNA